LYRSVLNVDPDIAFCPELPKALFAPDCLLGAQWRHENGQHHCPISKTLPEMARAYKTSPLAHPYFFNALASTPLPTVAPRGQNARDTALRQGDSHEFRK
jgi:hypothetical protein